MRIIIVDGFHKGHVLDLPNPSPTINLIKPKSVTVCDCDDPSIERFESDATEITYQLAFKSIDGKTALYSEQGIPVHFSIPGLTTYGGRSRGKGTMCSSSDVTITTLGNDREKYVIGTRKAQKPR